MWHNADFVFRRTSGTHLMPLNRGEIDDHIFSPLVALQAGHQILLDISRLHHVSSHSFSILHTCSNVRYLDVSYNRIDASHIALIGEHCQSLRALIIAGLKFTNTVKDYQPLSKLPQLEILSLRSCENLTSIELCRNMLMLRSLDLGDTNITSIEPLSRLTRLEELALDGCKGLHDDSCIQSSLNCLSQLKSLRLLNIQATALDTYVREDGMVLADVLHDDVCLEAKSRRELFVEAIIANDEIMLRRLVGGGQDLNVRVGPWAQAIMTAAWTNRCRTAKLQTPYVLCTHPDPELRPTPLHIAIMFNSQDCLAFLLFLNADAKCCCWFSDVQERSSELIMAESKASVQSTQVFTSIELVDAMFDRNVHRLTDGMIAKKLTDWKKRCAEGRDELTLIMKHEFHIILEKRKVFAEKQAAIERAALEKRLQYEAAVKAALEAKAAEEKVEREYQAKREAYFRGETDAPPEPLPKSPKAQTPTAWPDPDSKPGGEAGGTHDAAADPKAVPVTESSSAEAIVPPEAKERPEEDADDTPLEPAVYKKPGRKPLTMLPKRPSGFHWRGHSMISKLLDAPMLYKATKSRMDVEVMGKRSYWLESYGYVVSDKLHRDAKARMDYSHRIKSDALAASHHARVMMQKGLREYHPKDPHPARKDEFLGLVDAKIKRKYIVRDDISDDEEKGADSDSDKSL